MDINISFAKIVSTPSFNAWSQAYNAGNLYAVLSLSRKEALENEEEPLGKLGKDILNALESEYFTQEQKNLVSIKEALEKTIQEVPENISISLVVASFVKPNILYVFSNESGKIVLKRRETLGVILKPEQKHQKITSASGFLEDNDILILQTQKFSEIIESNYLSSVFDHLSPAEIAETIAPKIHQKEEGEACAIILAYKKIEEKEEEINNQDQEEQENFPPKPFKFNLAKIFQLFPAISFSKFIKLPVSLSHTKKMFLTISVVLVFVLLISIFFSLQKQKDEKNKKRFNEIYILAESKYKEGESLLSLNKNLAKDDLTEAQKILTNGKNEFDKNSNELKKIEELLKKVNSSLEQTKGINNIDLKPVDKEISQYLAYQIDNSTLSLFFQDDKNIYFLENEQVYSFIKQSKKRTNLLKNNNDWKKVLAINAYFDNLYILDKDQNQIFKFVKLNNGFSKNNYLKGSIDLSKAKDMAIDGSIYVLFDNGEILKFTKGTAEQFKVTGLDNQLNNPVKIYTNLDAKNIYILDQGNSRIVVIGKDGQYQSQYQNSIIANAKDFEVLEKDKLIYLLIKNKVYQLDLK